MYFTFRLICGALMYIQFNNETEVFCIILLILEHEVARLPYKLKNIQLLECSLLDYNFIYIYINQIYELYENISYLTYLKCIENDCT